MLGSSFDDEDRDRESVVEGVKAYFETVLEEEADATGDEAKAERARAVLEALEDDDFEPAFDYFTAEMSELEKERDQYERNDATAKAFMTRAIEQQLEDLERLKDSLSVLEE